MMKRENRYIVIKRSDLEKTPMELRNQLDAIHAVVESYRFSAGKRSLQCAVVESDWPEYETVWALIETRVEGGVMKDYSEFHDVEINLRVAKELKLELSSYARIIKLEDSTILLADNKTLFDPCNNPADAWPIIADNRINIEWHEWKDGTFKPFALSNKTMISRYDDNPLRAAMIVYLAMKEGNADAE